MLLGERLKDLRKYSELSMMQVATAIGASDASICKWENGDAEPKAGYIVKLASFFGCSTDYLLGVTDEFGNVGAPIATLKAVTPEERRLLDSVHKLDEDKRKLVYELIAAWVKLVVDDYVK